MGEYDCPGFIQSWLSVASLESLTLVLFFVSKPESFDPITPALLLETLFSLLVVVDPSNPWILEMLPVGLPGAVKEPGMFVSEGTLLKELPPTFNKLEKESVRAFTPPEDAP